MSKCEFIVGEEYNFSDAGNPLDSTYTYIGPDPCSLTMGLFYCNFLVEDDSSKYVPLYYRDLVRIRKEGDKL